MLLPRVRQSRALVRRIRLPGPYLHPQESLLGALTLSPGTVQPQALLVDPESLGRPREPYQSTHMALYVGLKSGSSFPVSLVVLSCSLV